MQRGTVRVVDVRLITPDGVQRRTPDEIIGLLAGPGLVWIDVQYWDADTAQFLAKRLGLHQRAVHDCTVRNPVPKVHVYPDQTFLVLHAPERGAGGHVHHIELDQFIGSNWLLTVHGPMNPVVSLDATYVETRAVARKLDSGRLRPSQGSERGSRVPLGSCLRPCTSGAPVRSRRSAEPGASTAVANRPV